MPPVTATRPQPQYTFPTDKTPIGSNFVREVDPQRPNFPNYHFRYVGDLPRTSAEIQKCVRAFKQFIATHPSVTVFPKLFGSEAQDALLTRAFSPGGTLWSKLAERSYVLGGLVDLSTDVARMQAPVRDVMNASPQLPAGGAAAPSPPVAIDSGKLDATGKDQARVYQQARVWVDSSIRSLERSRPFTAQDAVERARLVDMRTRFDNAALELASGKKALRMDSIDIFHDEGWRDTKDMTGSDRAAATMFDMACICERLNGNDNPNFRAERLICPGTDGGVTSTTAFPLIPVWIRDASLERFFAKR